MHLLYRVSSKKSLSSLYDFSTYGTSFLLTISHQFYDLYETFSISLIIPQVIEHICSCFLTSTPVSSLRSDVLLQGLFYYGGGVVGGGQKIAIGGRTSIVVKYWGITAGGRQ